MQNIHPTSRLWIQNELITYESEKDVIESGDWLTDSIIDAAQKILAVQFKARYAVNASRCDVCIVACFVGFWGSVFCW